MNAEQFARRITRTHLDAIDRFAYAMSPERQLADLVERQHRHAVETVLETIRTPPDGNGPRHPTDQER